MTLLVWLFYYCYFEMVSPCGARPFTPTAYDNCGEMQMDATVKGAVPDAKATTVPVPDAPFIIATCPTSSLLPA